MPCAPPQSLPRLATAEAEALPDGTLVVSDDINVHGQTSLSIIQTCFGCTLSDAEALLVRYAVAVERSLVDVAHSVLDRDRRGAVLEEMRGM